MSKAIIESQKLEEVLASAHEAISNIDGHDITGMKQMGRLIDKLRVGQTVVIKIYRNGQPMELDVLLTEKP